MSTNRNRAKLNKAQNREEYNRVLLKWMYPPYYDEGWTWHHGDLPNHKWREFKTWKHNRKTRWK